MSENSAPFTHANPYMRYPNGTSTIHRPVKTSRHGVEVDEGIADLIEAVWSNGLETQYCCQDLNDDGMAQIIFLDIDDGYQFLRKSVEGLGADELKRLVFGHTDKEFRLIPMEGGPYYGTTSSIRACIYFPAELIDDLAKLWMT